MQHNPHPEGSDVRKALVGLKDAVLKLEQVVSGLSPDVWDSADEETIKRQLTDFGRDYDAAIRMVKRHERSFITKELERRIAVQKEARGA
ncbi:MAG TPA: hypothetical protein VFA55_06155 [Candidatus Kapabacteria bacterium]|nr:hypothetical protein [Candidatus Kapabacteria bacterium]